MALRIVRATEPMPIANLVLTVYAPPGVGKTSLANTAEDPLTFDADNGAYRAQNRKDTVPVKAWEDLRDMNLDDLAPYKTVVLDTGGRVLDKIKAFLIDQNPKNAGGFGGMSAMGWNNLSTTFNNLVQTIIAAKKDLIIICHGDEKQQGDETRERIDVQGSSKNEIYKVTDAMCRIVLDSKGNRFLDFDPREGGFGKNPAQLPRIPFPHPDKQPDTLAKVIQQIKDSINRMTAEQAEAVKTQEQWNEAITTAENPEDFTLLSKLAGERKYDAGMKKALLAAAEAKGFEFDKASKAFVAKEEVAA